VAARATPVYLDLRLPDFDWRNPFANLVAFSDRAN
jgi:hypothetical protein